MAWCGKAGQGKAGEAVERFTGARYIAPVIIDRSNQARPPALTDLERRFADLVGRLFALDRQYDGQPPVDALAVLEADLRAVRERLAQGD